MATRIITKNSSTASAVPLAGDLVQGELAVNVTDKKIYTKDSSNAVVLLGGSGDVTLTGTQTLTNKTLTNPTVTNYTETAVTANTGTTYTIDITNGTVQVLTLTGNCTFTFPTATAGKGFTLLLKQDGTGSRTVTWPAAVKWPSGTAPTITSTASKMDKYVFVADGTNWIGSNAGQNYL